MSSPMVSEFILVMGHTPDGNSLSQAVFATCVYSFALVANLYFWIAPYFSRTTEYKTPEGNNESHDDDIESSTVSEIAPSSTADHESCSATTPRSGTSEDEDHNKGIGLQLDVETLEESQNVVDLKETRPQTPYYMPARSSKQPRLHFFDNLKSLCILAVVMHHVTCIFSPSGCFFYAFVSPIYDPGLGWSAAAAYFISLQQAYLMALFYFLSSYLVPSSFERKGASNFLRDRVRRLGLPLLVLAFGLNPLLEWFIWLGPVHKGGLEVFVPYSYQVDPDHLWFIIWLLIFDIGYALISVATRKMEPVKMDLPALPWILMAGVSLGFVKGLLFGFFDVDWMCSVMIAYFPDYVMMFTLGVIAKRNSWLTQLQEWSPASKRACIAITVVLALTLLPVRLAGSFFPGQQWLPQWLVSFLYGVNSAVFMVAMCASMLLIFQRFANFANTLTHRVSAAAYTVYLIHGWTLVPVAWSYAEMLTAAGQKLMFNMYVSSASLTTYWLVFVGAVYAAILGAPLTWIAAWLLAKAPILRRIL